MMNYLKLLKKLEKLSKKHQQGLLFHIKPLETVSRVLKFDFIIIIDYNLSNGEV